MDLSQTEADALLATEKCRTDDRMWDYPGLGGGISIPLTSKDKRESFLLDISRSGKIVLKGTYQNRARQVFVLARVDFGGRPHRNPDGSEMDGPHVHVYREGYGAKWAYPVSTEAFSNTDDPWVVLTDFMRFCNIAEPPIISKGLFT